MFKIVVAFFLAAMLISATQATVKNSIISVSKNKTLTTAAYK